MLCKRGEELNLVQSLKLETVKESFMVNTLKPVKLQFKGTGLCIGKILLEL